MIEVRLARGADGVVAVVDNGAIIGMGGVYESEGHYIAWIRTTERLRSQPVSLFRMLRLALNGVLRDYNPLYAIVPEARHRRFMRMLGFVDADDPDLMVAR